MNRLNGIPIEAKDLIVSLGSLVKTEFFAIFNVLSVFTHDKENLALLRLVREVLPIESANGAHYMINYICLPKELILNVKEEDAVVSGFGFTNPNNKPQNFALRKAMLLIDSPDTCAGRGYKSQFICGSEVSHMTCFVS